MKLIVVFFLIYCFSVHAQMHKKVNIFQPQPVLADAGANLQILQGESTLIGGYPAAKQGTPNYSFIWQPSLHLNNPTIANPTAFPTNTTTFRLFVTDSKGCTDIDSITITVGASGVEEMNINNLNISYNPLMKTISIVSLYTTDLKNVGISIFDMLGKEKYSEFLNNTGQISCAGYSIGIYLVRIKMMNHSFVKKIAIN